MKYYGYRLELEECYCDGCLAGDRENPVLLTSDCKVRPCVIKKGLKNCAHCERYPCQDLEARFIDGEKIVKKFGKPIPAEEYENFIAPYEGKKVLDKMRRKRRII